MVLHSWGGYLKGTSFLTDLGNRIVYWPEENYANGVAKNTATGRRFKGCVRILKHLIEIGALLAARKVGPWRCPCPNWPESTWTNQPPIPSAIGIIG
jgi:hypothetical protein